MEKIDWGIYNPDLPMMNTLDFGWRNPTVMLWVQIYRNGERFVVIKEYYERFRTPEENALATLKIHQAAGYPPPDQGWGDGSEPAALASFSKIWGVEFKGPSKRAVELGQEVVKQYFKMRLWDGLPGLLISRHCPQLVNEILPYLKHEPGKGAHHGPDALRYGIVGYLYG